MAGWTENEVLFYFERCRNTVSNVIDTLLSNESKEHLDHSLHSIEAVYTNMMQLEGEFSNLNGWNETVETISELLAMLQERVSLVEPIAGFYVSTSSSENRGRPKYNVTEGQLTILLELGFSNRAISNLLHVSEATVYRRLRFVYTISMYIVVGGCVLC